jgi:hypothetical protein
MESYRKMVLKPVESYFIECRDTIPGFTSFGLYQALRTEMTHVDVDTGLIEVSDDLCAAIDSVAEHITEHMKVNHDLGFGKSS